MTYTEEEIQDHREQWACALESGKYKQTRSQLKGQRGYCCLGVAELLVGHKFVKSESRKYWKLDIPEDIGYCSEQVEEWFDLSTYQVEQLVHLNDVSKKNFKYIANFIRNDIDRYL